MRRRVWIRNSDDKDRRELKQKDRKRFVLEKSTARVRNDGDKLQQGMSET